MADRITVKADLGQRLRRLAREYPEVMERESATVVDLIVRRLEAEVVERTPAGVGAAAGLRGSIHGEVVKLGEVVTGIVGTPLAYGEAVEYGTRPHMPPARPIILWAARKLGLSGVELRNAVRGIRWKIYRHGTEGAHMFEKGFKTTESWAMRMLASIPARVSRRLNDGLR